MKFVLLAMSLTLSAAVIGQTSPKYLFNQNGGMWNPWTHIEWQGKMYDLWNLKDRKGTVRFEKFN
jgi:hypothetical protein